MWLCMWKSTISEEILIWFLDYFNIFALCEQLWKIRILGPLLRQKGSPLGPLFAKNWVPFLQFLGPLEIWEQCIAVIPIPGVLPLCAHLGEWQEGGQLQGPWQAFPVHSGWALALGRVLIFCDIRQEGGDCGMGRGHRQDVEGTEGQADHLFGHGVRNNWILWWTTIHSSI